MRDVCAIVENKRQRKIERNQWWKTRASMAGTEIEKCADWKTADRMERKKKKVSSIANKREGGTSDHRWRGQPGKTEGWNFRAFQSCFYVTKKYWFHEKLVWIMIYYDVRFQVIFYISHFFLFLACKTIMFMSWLSLPFRFFLFLLDLFLFIF